jgi:two-component system, cell cycle response regulator DivK
MILVLLDNLFFAAKINQAAALSGINVSYAKSAGQALEMARKEHPSLIIIDLDETRCSPLDLIKSLKGDDELRSIPLLGFVSHVNTGIQEEARETGCDRVLARSVFDRSIGSILTQVSGRPA